MAEEFKRLTIELDPNLVKIFKTIAAMEGKTMKMVVEESIKEYIKEKAKVVSGGITASEYLK